MRKTKRTNFTAEPDRRRHAGKPHAEEQVDLVSPVDHIPGHSQHASHPGAAHHPATNKQGSDIDRLKA